MTLLHPWVLLLLPLPWICRRFCTRLLPAQLFSDPTLLAHSLRHRRFGTPMLRSLLFVLILLTLADPVTRHGVTVRHPHIHQIALLLDDSRSMEESGRFARARESLRRFILARPDDRIALGIFADYATIASPLTGEHAGLLTILKRLKTGMAGGRQTALYEALWRAAELFPDGGDGTRFVILITDGIDTVGNLPLSTALKRLRTKGVRVYPVGVGDDYRAEILRRIARETGGQSFEATDPAALPAILAAIDRQERRPATVTTLARYRHYERWLLGLALILTLGLLWRQRGKQPEILRLVLVGGLLVTAWMRPASPHAVGQDRAPRPLLIALDLSRSMDARDCPPDRLHRGIEAIRKLLRLLPPELPVALAGFARHPYLIAPPTREHLRLAALLDPLDPSAIDRDGTDLHALLDAVPILLDLNTSSPDGRDALRSLLLIVSDGGEARTYRPEARQARREGLRLYGLVVAGKRGVPIPTPTGPLKDTRGNIVLSRFNPAMQELIAHTGGTLLHCPLSSQRLEAFADRLAADAGVQNPGSQNRSASGVALWLAALLILLPIPLGRKKA